MRHSPFKIPLAKWLVGLMLGAATLVRILYFLEIRDRPDFSHPGLDAAYHDYWARGIAFSEWTPPPDQPDPLIRAHPYFRPPGYPFFLALVYRLTGGCPGPAHLAQFALGLLNIFLLWKFVRRWFGTPAALGSTLLACTYWGFVYYEGEWLEPTLLITLTWALLFALARWRDTPRLQWLFFAGLALGASALVRPNALLLAPLAAVWVLWIARPPCRKIHTAFPSVMVLAAGTMLVIAPVTLRNALAGKDRVLISSNGGINLLFGQDRNAIVDHASDASGNWNCFQYPLLLAQASSEAGRPLKPSEASRGYAARARALMIAHPRETLRLLALKTLLFWGPIDVANNKVEELERRDSRVLSRLPIRFSFILATGLLGLLILLGRRPSLPRATFEMAMLLAGLGIVYFLSFLPFIAAGQYRVPLIPLLMVPAGVGLAEIAQALAGRRWTAAGTGLLGGTLLWALVAPNYAGYILQPARFHLARGIAAERAGHLEEAESRYQAARHEGPGLAVAHDRLGILYARQNRLPEAISCFESAVAIDSASVETRFRLALAYSLAGRVENAIPLYESVLREHPGHSEARQNLATARRVTGFTLPPVPESAP